MAGTAAGVLATAGHENKAYDITNTQAYSYTDIAEYLSEISGKTIHYIATTPEAYAEALNKADVPARAADIIIGFALAQAQRELDRISNDLAALLKRQPVPLKEYLKYFYQHQQSA